MMGVTQWENPDIAWAVNMIIGNLKETYGIGKFGAPESLDKRK
jgi:hypothetical protein